MRKCARTFISDSSGRGLPEERGAVALVLVLGATFVLLVIALTVAGQARQELRMATAELQAARVQTIVEAAFNEVAVAAETDSGFPGVELSDGTSFCTPRAPYPGAPYPWYCRQVLQGRHVATQPLGTLYQYPVRVVWQATSTSDVQETYGWIQVDDTQPDPVTGLPQVLGVWYDHTWCTAWSGLRTCKVGG